MEGVRKCGRRCGEMCWGVEKCGGRKGEMWGRWRKWVEYSISPTSPTLQHTSPTLQHTSPHLPQHLFSHLPPHFCTPTPTLPHSFHIPAILDPTPQTTNNSPITPPSILLPILYNPLFFPILLPRRTTIVTLSFTPHQNFSLFSFIVKLIQQSNTLATPCKFHKKKFNNKNIK